MTLRFTNTRPIDVSFHHENHRHLLTEVTTQLAPQAPVDALIVPTSRPIQELHPAMSLASGLGCVLVAMCSGAVKATEVADLGHELDVPVIAVNVTDHEYGLPKPGTTELIEGTHLIHSSDASRKRNLGLLLARVAGWRRILFLDDDIDGILLDDARAAVGLLDEFDVVGIRNDGYPDNSVVCHAYRYLGPSQSQFIGAGALAVAPLRSRSFFLHTYNQDWFFFLGFGQPARLAVTGQMRQREYDPFADRERARREELGDCPAEGLFWLLDHRLPIGSADVEHWRDFLIRRECFIDHVITQVAGRRAWDRGRRKRIINSLETARATLRHVTPGLCAEYVRRWRADLEIWRNYVRKHPVGLGPLRALEYLKWPNQVVSERTRPSAEQVVPRRAGVLHQTAQPRVCRVPTTGVEPNLHHGTHRHLLALKSPVGVRAASPDALIVPTCRSIEWLDEVMSLAARLDCILMAICSNEVTAAEVSTRARDRAVATVALDLKTCEHILLGLSTSKLVDGTALARNSDVTEKRNVSLLVSRMTGWERVVFFDDDIHTVEPGNVRAAVGLLERYDAVGMHNLGFPDNSVVCHAYREVGGYQGQFVGAGALAVSPMSTRSFFPGTYNDDWLFLVGEAQPPRVAVTGSMRQRAYEPFADPDRARSEEFGDCIAEGLYWLLDDGSPLERAGLEYWGRFLRRRARFIERLIVQVCRVIGNPDRRAKLVASLTAARETNEKITPERCAEYVDRWRSDLSTWQHLLDEFPTGLGLDEALEQLDLAGVVHRFDP